MAGATKRVAEDRDHPQFFRLDLLKHSRGSLEEVAWAIAAVHKPIEFDWKARFGLEDVPAAPAQEVEVAEPSSKEASPAPANKKSKLFCAACKISVAYNVARFCGFNKAKFGGKVYCMDCQKKVQPA